MTGMLSDSLGCIKLPAHSSPGSLKLRDPGNGAVRPRLAGCQGQRPSISTSSEKLRNVRMSTISPRTATF
jgi:hypothetical protein